MLLHKYAPLRWALIVLLFTGALSAFAQKGREEFGKAAYYSDKFQGSKTASGAPYNKNAFTCAHKSYPFGTKLLVTRLDNQKSVEVTVTDRGPYSEGFIVDLSRRAAETVDLIKVGTARVKIEVLDTAKPQTGKSDAPATSSKSQTAPVAQSSPGSGKVASDAAQKDSKTAPKPVEQTAAQDAPAKTFQSNDLYRIEIKKTKRQGFGVQIMTLNNADNMLREVAALQSKYPGKVLVQVESADDGADLVYKLVLGVYADRKAAEKAQKEAAKKGHSKCFIVSLSDM